MPPSVGVRLLASASTRSKLHLVLEEIFLKYVSISAQISEKQDSSKRL